MEGVASHLWQRHSISTYVEQKPPSKSACMKDITNLMKHTIGFKQTF